MRLIFAFVALFSVYEAWSCEIKLPETIFIADSTNRDWNFIQQNCQRPQLRELQNILQDQSGTVAVSHIQAAISRDIRLVASEENIKIQNLNQIIRQTFSEAENASIMLQSPFQGSLVYLEAGSEYVLHCHPCQFNGEELMRLHVKTAQGESVDYNFPAKFSRLVSAYKLRRHLPAFSDKLTREMFEEAKVPMASYGQYLTDLSQISLYKTNKSLRAGDVLRTQDLVPLTLVRAGDRVELIFENAHVRLKAQAMSRQSGGIGDRVEVWNQANGKKYRGTVIEQNRVVVEL